MRRAALVAALMTAGQASAQSDGGPFNEHLFCASIVPQIVTQAMTLRAEGASLSDAQNRISVTVPEGLPEGYDRRAAAMVFVMAEFVYAPLLTDADIRSDFWREFVVDKAVDSCTHSERRRKRY